MKRLIGKNSEIIFQIVQSFYLETFNYFYQNSVL